MGTFKVAYVHPAPHGRAERSRVPLDAFQNQPAGLTCALNNLVRSGTELVGINEAIELRLDPSFALQDWLKRQAPDLVLVELHWYVHTHGARRAARMAKTALPRVPVVMGGLTATAFSAEILLRWPVVDMVLAGEVDAPLSMLVQQIRSGSPLDAVPNLWRRHGESTIPPERAWCAETLDGLDHVDMGWLEHLEDFERSDLPYRNRWLLTGRGCPHSCFFCGGSRPGLARLFGRERVLVRPPDHVAADIVRLARTGVEAVHLTHDLFSVDDQYWRSLFDVVRSSGVTVGLANESWGPVPGDDLLEAWAATFDVARSYIALSPTSAWSGLAALASKRTVLNELFHALDTMASLRFPLHVFFLLNIPGETPRTFERTIDLASAILQRYPGELLRLEAQPASVDPGSPAAMGLTKRFRFQPPTLDDYLAVSSGEYVMSLNWPLEESNVDPGEPLGVMPAKPREIMALASRCPSFADRWRDLLRVAQRDKPAG
ncbi:radical SAM protein [Candidatus Fermentibacteria bacterium]|nr:radical SAM protein [Candidatus Fermentibacteria bacterium]